MTRQSHSLGIYPEKTTIQKDTWYPMFISAPFPLARSWKQPRCPLTNEWIKKLRYIYIMEYCFCCLVAEQHLTLAAPWTIAYQAPLSVGFPMRKYKSGLPSVSPEDLLDPVIEPASPPLAVRIFTTEPPRKPQMEYYSSHKMNKFEFVIQSEASHKGKNKYVILTAYILNLEKWY